ncbi:hypothetical protein ASG04_14535 [Curtobacterium sp. Leaf183]|uniref:hypothetical protein n=1 Tax=Curtobacterium sp. Leaf183 TaxID=1736291 RepID=UPI0006F78EB8|nr:hypothetical protein [Curtobacterium sp. Leaf183]KQS08319.1 hypothetical protein ASG04_14535 [Curtobacterium sp. Leaf183]
MRLIWATRGKTWGFRFVRTGGLANPLEVYEEAFTGSDGEPFTFTQRADTLAVRIPDPQRRKDRAGRVIPHEFVVLAPDHLRFSDCESARAALWHEVEEEYASIWDEPASSIPR